MAIVIRNILPVIQTLKIIRRVKLTNESVRYRFRKRYHYTVSAYGYEKLAEIMNNDVIGGTIDYYICCDV